MEVANALRGPTGTGGTKHVSQHHLRWEDLLSLAAPIWDVSVYQSLLGRCWCLLTGKSESVSHWDVSDSLRSHGLQPTRLLCPWDSPGKNTGVSCHSLQQGIFPTKRSNLSLLNCRQSLYHPSHQGELSWCSGHLPDKTTAHTSHNLPNKVIAQQEPPRRGVPKPPRLTSMEL